MEDMLEMNTEINDALSRQYDTPDVKYKFHVKFIDYLSLKIDEADLEAELEALGDELQLDADTSYLDEAISAPSVPTKVPGSSIVSDFNSI
jgi:charged multivesicular body protein 5